LASSNIWDITDIIVGIATGDDKKYCRFEKLMTSINLQLEELIYQDIILIIQVSIFGMIENK
jgi:hypothetical protein